MIFKEGKDLAYWERNQLVAHLSKIYPSWLEKHPEEDASWEADWRNIVFIETPGGQCSWHIHDSELPYFLHLTFREGSSWDGHSMEEKYKRLEKNIMNNDPAAMLPSISETNGLHCLTENDKKIYSIGISTGGAAEIRMAANHPKRHVIATTVDPVGEAFAKKQISSLGLSHQIEIKIEDVAEPLPYPEGYFDFLYARLVLHYLPKKSLDLALHELFRVLKTGGKMFVVVRSTDCLEAHGKNARLDPETGLTTYISEQHSYSRYFHTEESIQRHLVSAGFSIQYVKTYKEQLCVDFERTKLSKQIDSLIEVLAVK